MSDDTNALARALLGYPWSPPNTLNTAVPVNPFDIAGTADLFSSFTQNSKTNALARVIASAPAAPSIWDPVTPFTPMPSPPNKLARVIATREVVRKVYFAFSFDDVMRVNNVRQTGKIGPRVIGRSRGFLDRSIWERRNIKNEQNLKRIMQQAASYSSVVCVLIGTDTWDSRWVRYEIALSVINEKGLLALHINSLNFVGGTGPDPLGVNPLHFMGIHRDKNGKYYLVERKIAVLNEATGDVGFKWYWYDDYQLEVPRPKYMPELAISTIVPLSTGTKTYDYSTDIGSKNIGLWLDAAAVLVGR